MAKEETIVLFPPHLRAIAEALQAIFIDGGYADKVIERTLKADKRRGARDRAFIAENVYEVVRWYRLLYTLRGSMPKQEQDWWEMLGSLKWGIMCMMMYETYRNGGDTSVERAAIGRRVSETEIDLINLLERQ